MTTQEVSKNATPGAGPSLTAIFLTFLRLGCTSFGGGTAGWLHRDIVLHRHWIDDAAFLQMLTVGQALPGSNGTKLTVLIGQHLRGMAGAPRRAAWAAARTVRDRACGRRGLC